MTILVTGGAGFIGSHMVYELTDNGHDVVVLDNLSTGFDWAISPRAKFYQGDIADPGLLYRIAKENEIDAIIHFAGSIIVPESVENPLKYYENNTAKSRKLIEFAVRHQIKKFIFSSTAAVYGTPNHPNPVSEDEPLKPESPYGMSKLMTEYMLKDTAKAHDFNFVALRYFNVAGGDPKYRTGQSTIGATHLIKVACEVAKGKRQRLEIFGDDYDTPDGSCIRDYIHVTDLAKAHLCAYENLGKTGESLIANCGYGKGFSVFEVVDAVKKVSKKDFETKISPRRAGDATRIVANPKTAFEKLGWKPEYDNLELIISHALEWEDRLLKRNAK